MGNKIEDDYDLKETLGTGTFSKVVLAICKKTNQEFAVKVIDKKEVDEPRLRMEVEILKKVKHPNIISLKEVYDDDPKKLYLVMELVTGGELFNKIVEIGSYSENIAKRLVKQMVSAVKHLHNQSIAHRDLKPNNLLVPPPPQTSVAAQDLPFLGLFVCVCVCVCDWLAMVVDSSQRLVWTKSK
jgi:serine/threonine protein kinase